MRVRLWMPNYLVCGVSIHTTKAENWCPRRKFSYE